jgi:hypothetical protein
MYSAEVVDVDRNFLDRRCRLVGWSFTDGGAFICTNVDGVVWARQLRPGDEVRVVPQ